MATKKAAAAASRAPMSDEHKEAISQGRQEVENIRPYLDALRATSGPKPRGRKANPEKRLAEVDAALEGASSDDVMRVLVLRQERRDLLEKLAASAINELDLEALAANFVKFAAAYSERKGIAYPVWREMGVPIAMLKEAGITK
jgi:hypothetical protein